jgi:ribosomal protein S18 acetylase RimI-like enzyme
MRSGDIYRQVAQLHAGNIDQGFLSTLGVPFLTLLYEAIDGDASSVLLIEEKDGRVAGFVAGAIGMRPIYRQLLRRWPRLIPALMPALLSPRKLWRMVEILMLGSKPPVLKDLPHAELLSIAVSPEMRGKGCAQALYLRLTRHFEETGTESFRIVVGEALHPAHRFYTRMGARVVGEVEIHRGRKSLVYTHRCLPAKR